MHTLCRRSRPWHMRAGVALLLALIVSPFVAPFGPVGMACADDGEGGGDQERASKSVDPEARRLYEQALIHFKAGALDEAIQKLQAAFLLAPAPELLYDLGQAYRLKGDCARALDFYRRFLACDPEGAALERAQVRKSEMEKCAAADAGAVDPSTAKPTAPSSTPPSTPLLADAPLAGDLPSTPPSSSVAVTIAIPPLVQARNTTPEKAPSRWRRNRPALAMAVSAVVLFSASGYFAWRAHHASDQVSQVFDQGRPWTAADAETQQTGMWSDRLAMGSGILGVAAGGLAAWLFWRE